MIVCASWGVIASSRSSSSIESASAIPILFKWSGRTPRESGAAGGDDGKATGGMRTMTTCKCPMSQVFPSLLLWPRREWMNGPSSGLLCGSLLLEPLVL